MILAYLPLFFAGGYALFHFTSLKREFRVFAWFLFFSAIIQGIALGLWFGKINNMPALHVYVALGFPLLIWFYQAVLRSFINPRLLWWVAGLFFIFTIINSLCYQSIWMFNSYALTVQSVLMVVLSLSTYTLQLNRAVKDLKRDELTSLNWINSGLFIYFVSNLLLYYFGDFIMHALPADLSKYTWTLHSFFATVLYVCICVGLWILPKHQNL